MILRQKLIFDKFSVDVDKKNLFTETDCLMLMVVIYVSCQIRTSTYSISQLEPYENQSNNSSSSHSYAAEIKSKRSILPLTLLATSTKHFIIKERTEEIRLISTSTNARNLSRHFHVSSFSFKSRLDVRFCPVKFN